MMNEQHAQRGRPRKNFISESQTQTDQIGIGSGALQIIAESKNSTDQFVLIKIPVCAELEPTKYVPDHVRIRRINRRQGLALRAVLSGMLRDSCTLQKWGSTVMVKNDGEAVAVILNMIADALHLP